MRSNPVEARRDREDGMKALGVALAILAKIEEHGAVVANTLNRNRATP